MFRHRSDPTSSRGNSNDGPKRRRRRRPVSPVPLRRWLARHPRFYWLIVAAVAWLAGSSAAAHTRQLEAAETALGTTVSVWVATTDIARGETVTAEQRRVPVAYVPAAALTDLHASAVSRQAIAAGELLVTADVATNPRQLAPDGWVIVAVVESPSSGSARGDTVQVASGGMVIADQAIVIEVAADRTLVAVPVAAGPMVATADHEGDIALLRMVDGPTR